MQDIAEIIKPNHLKLIQKCVTKSHVFEELPQEIRNFIYLLGKDRLSTFGISALGGDYLEPCYGDQLSYSTFIEAANTLQMLADREISIAQGEETLRSLYADMNLFEVQFYDSLLSKTFLPSLVWEDNSITVYPYSKNHNYCQVFPCVEDSILLIVEYTFFGEICITDYFTGETLTSKVPYAKKIIDLMSSVDIAKGSSLLTWYNLDTKQYIFVCPPDVPSIQSECHPEAISIHTMLIPGEPTSAFVSKVMKMYYCLLGNKLKGIYWEDDESLGLWYLPMFICLAQIKGKKSNPCEVYKYTPQSSATELGIVDPTLSKRALSILNGKLKGKVKKALTLTTDKGPVVLSPLETEVYEVLANNGKSSDVALLVCADKNPQYTVFHSFSY